MKITDKKNIEDILPLTPMQEGMLFHYLKDRESDYYFEQLCLTITGEIDLTWFRQAWALVVETNEILRTRFIWGNIKKPMQVLLKKSPLQFIFHDFSNGNINENDKRNLVQGIKDNDRKIKFNLNSVPFRITLCKIGEAEYEMMISNHHILYDGWSNGILLKEFFSFYNCLEQKESPVKSQKHKYKEYISWIQGQDVQKQREYWTRYLNGIETKSELSIKRRKGKNINSDAPGNSQYNVKFSKKAREKLEIFIKSHKITLAGLLYSAWGILLQGYNNSDDVIFGTTVSGRSSEVKGIEDIVGMFINTVPLRVRTNSSGHEKIKDFLYRVNKELREREEHESASLVEIREYGEVVFEDELFDTIVVIENYPLEKVLSEKSNPLSLSVDSYSMFETTHYDLTVGITLIEDIEVEFNYNKDLFDESIIKELSRHFVKIAAEMVDNPGKELAALEILSEAEKKKILFEFNNTATDYAEDKTIHQLFAGQVERIPDRTAVIGPLGMKYRTYMTYMTYISYRELNNRSDRLARALIEKGVQPDTIVGIMMERSIEMIIGIFGILKAGGAYLPIDPDYPEERIDYMLKDSGAKILLTGREIAGLYSPQAFKTRPKGTPLFGIWNLEFGISPRGGQLAYVIYTSGTTGKPKGVMIEHSAVMNRLYWVRDKYRLNERDVILQATSFVFDVSVCEMFRWIPAGGKLCLLLAGGEKDPGQIVRTIARNGVTTADFIPAMLTLLLDYANRQNLLKELAGLRWVWTGVEVVDVELVKEFNETLHRLNRTRLINAYGPTESTVDVTYFDCSHIGSDDVVPIGRPMANVRIYILARNGAVQPVGVYGQLCIAGKGLARGYLNNPELTSQKFQRGWHPQPIKNSKFQTKRSPSGVILNAFGEKELYEAHEKNKKINKKLLRGGVRKAPCAMRLSPGRRRQKIYTTGDLARWLPDGDIQFLGRMDHQVKIRGHRVELGEIESRLLRHEKIKDTVVIVRGGNEKEKYLCAYIVSEERIDVPGLRAELSLELSDYMVPSYIEQLDKIPLTTSGKLDRRALPGPGPGIIGVEYTAPVDPLEEKLVSIWSDVLNLEKNEIGTGYNFFKLGGHSLKAVRLISGIQKELNVEVPLEEIFKLPTIRELAGYIRGSAEEKYVSPKAVEEKEYYALASEQRRLYFLQEIDENATAYNMPSVWLMEGVVDKKRLEGTLKKLIQRHESLRTSFKMMDRKPVQVVHEEVEFEIDYYDLQVTGASDRCRWEEEPFGQINAFGGKKGIENFEGTRGLAPLIKNFIRPFDLSRAPLLRGRLSKEGEQSFLFMVDMHHIISDGISVEILIKEFMAFWVGEKLPSINLRYRDYSGWQRNKKQKEKIKPQEAYWLKQFEGEIPVLDLPMDYTRPSVQNFAGRTIHFEIDKEEADALKSLAHDREVTLFMLLLSFYNVFLCKLSGQEDIVVGTPIATRGHTDLEGIIGMFVNTMALRNFPVMEKPFSLFLGEVRENTIKAFENRDYLYEDLVEQLSISRDASRNPVFDVVFAVQNVDIPKIEIPGLKIEPYPYENHLSKFDLTFICEETQGSLLFSVEYCTRLFKEESILGFIRYFRKIISHVLHNRDIMLGEIEILYKEEKARILYEFNDTGAEYPQSKVIHELFAEQAERSPDHIAVVEPGYTSGISYKELNRRGNQLAQVLQIRGVTADIVVGLLMERRLEMLIAMLGILKACGAYLPIVPHLPLDRQQYMIRDAAVRIVLSCGDKASGLNLGNQLILLDEKNFYAYTDGLKINDPDPERVSRPQNAAYVIYTSGSTGKPKGVIIEHAQLINFVFHMYNRCDEDMGTGDNCLNLTEISFDVSVCELFFPLPFGASIVLLAEEAKYNANQLAKVILEQKITFAYIPPGLLPEVSYHLQESAAGSKPMLNKMLVGVEPIRDNVLEEYLKLNPGLRLLNGYGPTETTICATMLRYQSHQPGDRIVPIGSPLSNMKVVILDKGENLVPVGIVGELCASGAGVGRGYLNDPISTAERFVSNSWFPGERMYKTGDLGRWLENGNIEFIGRMDQQVKIRGYRIEPGEIENQMLKVGAIRKASVIVRQDLDSEKYLCGYIVSEENINIGELKKQLSKYLPDYMTPSYILQIHEIPVTPHGKLDSKALPMPDRRSEKEYVAPRNELEEKLVEIWSEVLNIESAAAAKEFPGKSHGTIGIDDNFFELGGHSLKATQLISRIHKELNVKVPLVEIFRTPLIRGLAEFIKGATEHKFFFINPAEQKEYYALSSAQKRLYVLQQMDEQGIGYNIPSLWTVEGNIDKDRLEDTFRRLIQRHESLRTSFRMVNGEPVQRIHEENPNFQITMPLSIKKAGAVSIPNSKSQIPNIIKDFIRPFDLAGVPLLRVGLIKRSDGTSVLMIDMHHIVSDGTSMSLVVKDFTGLYSDKNLPAPRIQYKDFSGWQNGEQQKERIKHQEVFWVKEFEGEIPVLDLPIDYPRPTTHDFEGNSVNFEVTPGITDALKTLASETGTTMYMILLALYNIFLARISNGEDIVIGSPVAGRRHADLEKIIGMFVNTLAIRNYPSGEKTFAYFMQEVKERTLNAFENQEYQYEDLLEQVAVSRDISRNPLFDTMLILQNMGFQEIEIAGLKLVPYEHEHKTAKFDLTLIGVEKERKLLLTFEYSTKLFKVETVQRLITYFKNVVSAVIDDKYRRIAELEIIPPEEKNRILYDFNATQADFPRDKTIHQLFEEQVEKMPDHIALVSQSLSVLSIGASHESPLHRLGQQMTYRELNEKANQLAWILSTRGVKPGIIIGFMPERSVEIMIGLFAILKAGGAYVPLGAEYPGERLSYILDECSVEIFLPGAVQKLPHDSSRVIIDINNNKNFKGNTSNLPQKSSPNNLAYVIYTSGSTGLPKGVMIENRSVVNFIKGITDIIPFTEKDKILSLTTISFDIFGLETLIPLTRGSRVVIGNREEQLDVEGMASTLEKEKITILQVTPSRLQLFLIESEYARTLRNLNYLLVGGESFPDALLNKTRLVTGGKVKIYNLYGPTETTIWSTVKDVTDEKSINIGKPIANTQVYILGKSEGIQPPGIPGELCIAGDGLARGYLNQPELTAERFKKAVISHRSLVIGSSLKIKDRSQKREKAPGKRIAPLKSYTSHMSYIYFTGDRARWLPDGNIQFLGRIDHQVKIRGFRIELQEIESQLLKHPLIKEAVVLAREDQDSPGTGYMNLGAYIVPSYRENLKNTSLMEVKLREYLADILPDYMIPGYFMLLEKLPLTHNGKINRKVLPELQAYTKTTGFTAPADEIERKLASVWSEVLKIEKEAVDVNSNFFNIGGHSLRAIQLVSRIHRVFNVRMPLLEIFKKNTIKKLAPYIKEAAFDKHFLIEAVEKKEYYILSPAQRGLYFREHLDKGGITNNMPTVYILEGDIHRSRLENSFKELIKRHESLRTSFVIAGEEPFQRVHKEVKFELETSCPVRTAGSSQSADFRRQVKDIIQHFLRPFDLSRAPLLRVRLLEMEKKKHILMIDMSHLISDGISGELFIKEYKSLYSGEELPPLKIQYKDFAEWQKMWMQKGELEEQEEYWLNRFSSQESFPGLPTDFSRQSSLFLEGECIDFVIETGLKKDLARMAIETETTLYMALLAAFNILLAKHSLQECVIVGSPVLGRTHSQLENVIGMFVNLLAMMNFPTSGKTFREFLSEVKDNSLHAFANQDYPFDELVKKLNLQKIPGRHPLFDSVFSFFKNEDRNDPRHNWGDFRILPYQLERTSVKFDLQLRVNDDEDILRMTMEYKASVFKRDTVETMIKHFIEILDQAAEKPDIAISSIKISHDLLAADADILEKDREDFAF